MQPRSLQRNIGPANTLMLHRSTHARIHSSSSGCLNETPFPRDLRTFGFQTSFTHMLLLAGIVQGVFSDSNHIPHHGGYWYVQAYSATISLLLFSLTPQSNTAFYLDSSWRRSPIACGWTYLFTQRIAHRFSSLCRVP